jgi:hypothetical protein
MIIGAVEGKVAIKVSFVIDDVTDAAGHSPIIIPKIHDRCAFIGDQIDVICRRVRLIENVGKICLQIKTGERIPVKLFADHMLFNHASLLFVQQVAV